MSTNPHFAFKTYLELMIDDGVDASKVADFAKFQEWLPSAMQANSPQVRVRGGADSRFNLSGGGSAGYGVDAEPRGKSRDRMLWNEMGIRSGYERDGDYLSSIRENGVTLEQRKQVCDLYGAWVKTGLILPSLYRLKTRLATGFVVVDEAQDFSYGQLRSILDYAQGRVLYLLGDQQVLTFGYPKIPFLQRIINSSGSSSKDFRLIRLSDNYRCSAHVLALADKILALKHHLSNAP